MPDDCPVDDEARRALRDLARRAEWRGQAGAAGAALDARTLREVGRQIEVALAREDDHEPWSYRASEQLAAYCQRAQPEWTPEQVAELSRLREEAVIALAPGPGESDVEPEGPRGRSRILASVPRGGFNLSSRNPRVIALAAVGTLVLIAVIVVVAHLLSSNSNQTPVASATNSAPAAPSTTASTAAPSPSQSATPTATATTSATTSAAPPSSAPATSPSASSVTSTSDGGGGSTSSVTAIQLAPEPGQGYPEVLVEGTITTSGTGDVTIHVVISGTSGQQPQDQPIDDSGQTTYALSQTRYLQPWCGQSSVRVTVYSGSVSQSATVPVTGC